MDKNTCFFNASLILAQKRMFSYLIIRLWCQGRKEGDVKIRYWGHLMCPVNSQPLEAVKSTVSPFASAAGVIQLDLLQCTELNSVNWSIHCTVDWSIYCTVDWSIYCTVDWSMHCTLDWSIHCTTTVHTLLYTTLRYTIRSPCSVQCTPHCTVQGGRK